MANGTSRLNVASPGVNFLMKSDIAVLNMTGAPTRAIHGADRLTRTSCPLSPCLSTLFEKISPPPDKHLRKDIPSTVGVLCFENPMKASKPNSCYGFLYSSKSFTYLIPVFKSYTCVFGSIYIPVFRFSLFHMYFSGYHTCLIIIFCL